MTTGRQHQGKKNMTDERTWQSTARDRGGDNWIFSKKERGKTSPWQARTESTSCSTRKRASSSVRLRTLELSPRVIIITTLAKIPLPSWILNLNRMATGTAAKRKMFVVSTSRVRTALCSALLILQNGKQPCCSHVANGFLYAECFRAANLNLGKFVHQPRS